MPFSLQATAERGARCRRPDVEAAVLFGEDATPCFRRIDCVRLPVDDLDEAIRFYGHLGHELIWRRTTQAGLRLPESESEIVLQTTHPEQEIDFLVDDVEVAADRFTSVGGRVASGPFDIEVGRCVVVEDPFGNRLVLLDLRYGLLT
jgi:predicted enzyme related to lactoylglutathione lyase